MKKHIHDLYRSLFPHFMPVFKTLSQSHRTTPRLLVQTKRAKGQKYQVRQERCSGHSASEETQLQNQHKIVYLYVKTGVSIIASSRPFISVSQNVRISERKITSYSPSALLQEQVAARSPSSDPVAYLHAARYPQENFVPCVLSLIQRYRSPAA